MKIMSMEFPICNVCLKNEILCSGCSKKLESSGVRDEEIRLYRNLNKAIKSEKHLKDGKISRIYLDKNFALIVCDKNTVPGLIGKNGIIIKKIEKILGKQIRVISDSLTFNEFIKEILFSSTVLGVNIMYTQEGMKYRIRIPGNERIIMPLSPEAFTSIANKLFNTTVELVFE